MPLALIVTVSFWQATDYELIPAFTLQSYADLFTRAVTLRTCVYAEAPSTLKFSVLTWLLTLVIGFTVAYFLAFHVKSTLWQTVLFILCTVPFWTSNVIRMISWIPLLGRNGLVNDTLLALGLVDQPVEWLLFSASRSRWPSCTCTRCS